MRLAQLSAGVALIAAAQSLPAQPNSITLTALGTLTISVATPGGQPASSSSAGTYSVHASSGRVKVTAQLDTPMPAGVTLTLSLAAPAGSVGLGPTVLTTSSQNVVRFIPIGDYNGLSVSLQLSSSVTAGVVPYNTSHVLLTLVDDP
jgi:hypothetical protein